VLPSFLFVMTSRVLLMVLLLTQLGLLNCALVSGDFALNLYSDSACSIPSTLVPAVSNNAVTFAYDAGTCSQSLQLTQLIPTVGQVEWFWYYCTSPAAAEATFASFALLSYDYSAPGGGCPTNSSMEGFAELANSSLTMYQYGGVSAACSSATFYRYNSTLGLGKSTQLYGNWSCTNSAQRRAIAPVALGSLVFFTFASLLMLG